MLTAQQDRVVFPFPDRKAFLGETRKRGSKIEGERERQDTSKSNRKSREVTTEQERPQQGETGKKKKRTEEHGQVTVPTQGSCVSEEV